MITSMNGVLSEEKELTRVRIVLGREVPGDGEC
jgi:hypothetical protein